MSSPTSDKEDDEKTWSLCLSSDADDGCSRACDDLMSSADFSRRAESSQPAGQSPILTPTIQTEESQSLVKQITVQVPPLNASVLSKKSDMDHSKRTKSAPFPASSIPRKKRQSIESLSLAEDSSKWREKLERNSLKTEEEDRCTGGNQLDLTLATKGTLKLVKWLRFHRIYRAGGVHIRFKTLGQSRLLTYVMNASDYIGDLPDTNDIVELKDREEILLPKIIKQLLEHDVRPPRIVSRLTRYVVLECNGDHWQLLALHDIKSAKPKDPENFEPKQKLTGRAETKGPGGKTIHKSRRPRKNTFVSTDKKRRTAAAPGINEPVNNSEGGSLVPLPGPFGSDQSSNGNVQQQPSRATSPPPLMPIEQQERPPPPPNRVNNNSSFDYVYSSLEDQQLPMNVSTSVPGVITVKWGDKETHFPRPKSVELDMVGDEAPFLKISFESISGRFEYLCQAETSRLYSLNHRDDQYSLLAIAHLPEDGIQLPGCNAGVLLKTEVIKALLNKALDEGMPLWYQMDPSFSSLPNCRMYASPPLKHHVIIGPFSAQCNIRLPHMIPLKPNNGLDQVALAAASVNKEPHSSGCGSSNIRVETLLPQPGPSNQLQVSNAFNNNRNWQQPSSSMVTNTVHLPERERCLTPAPSHLVNNSGRTVARPISHHDEIDVKPAIAPLFRHQLIRVTGPDGSEIYNIEYEQVIKVRLPSKKKVFVGSVQDFHTMMAKDSSQPLYYDDQHVAAIDLEDDHLDPIFNEPEPRAEVIIVGHCDGTPIKAEKWFRVEDPLVDKQFKYFYSVELAKQWAREYIKDIKKKFTPAAISVIN